MLYRKLARLGAILLLLTSTPALPAAAPAANLGPDYAIVGIHVIPMDEERVLENQVVVVSGGVIQSVGDIAATTLPADMPQIAGNGRYLLPGLADLHVHLQHEDELIGNLAWGVTTIMHLGGSASQGQRLLRYREEIAGGERLGPNIYATGRILDGDPAVASGARSLTTPEQARAAVRELGSDGYDFVKIYNNVSKPIFDTIVDEAGGVGLAVLGHIPRNFDALEALRGGQNAVVHTEEFFFAYFDGPRSTGDMPRNYEADMSKLPALIDALTANDVAVMPDLSFTFTNMLMWDDLEHLWTDPEFAYLQPGIASMWQVSNINRRSNLDNFMVREQWKFELMQTLTIAFQQAGVLQVVGTDASLPGLFPGKAVHRELTELVKAGISTFDALAMGTRNAGQFIQRYIDKDTRVGQIRPGFRADFMVLRENPLRDVRNARTIDGVSVQGRYTERLQLDRVRAEFRDRYEVLHAVNAHVDGALQLPAAQAENSVRELLATHADDEEIAASVENRINAAGYSAAYAGDLDHSERILELNTRLFPNSANTWDSLAEVVLYRGDRERALQLYRKALEADPTFRNAADKIQSILKDIGD